ncbi:hypothetical protein F5Y04DRAFT_274478 [Hypomontagnella monticulosa]|nr:hypothetical protein F5Y04DRAFT_274478 [Hypomontagnella monticulosa]
MHRESMSLRLALAVDDPHDAQFSIITSSLISVVIYLLSSRTRLLISYPTMQVAEVGTPGRWITVFCRVVFPLRQSTYSVSDHGFTNPMFTEPFPLETIAIQIQMAHNICGTHVHGINY